MSDPNLIRGLASPEDINCHFVICNGLGANDGQIQRTEKWQRQWLIPPAQTSYGRERTIYISVIADGKGADLTDLQRKRIAALTESLSRKFNINPDSIYYPNNWL